MRVWLLLPLIVVGSYFLTGGLRRYALANRVFDIPNARSSHLIPTPRGGGMAIVISFLIALIFLGFTGWLSRSTVFALAGAGGVVALLGFLDDHGHIAAKWRLVGHFTGAAWLLFWIGGLESIEAFGAHINMGWAGQVLTALYLVWLLNLYNFMDGIDGIASVEAISVALGGSILFLLYNEIQGAFLCFSIAAAVLGFLIWNFPPARIFMGDAGSGFLGITLGGMSLTAAKVSVDLLWSWLILLGVFVVDATFTLVRRLLRGDKVYEAHRSHAYQQAARRLGQHLPVTLIVGAINMLWLFPLALGVGLGWLDGIVGLLMAYTPLLILVVKMDAGNLQD